MQAARSNVGWLVAYIAAIVLVVIAIRGAWAYISLKLVSLRATSERHRLQMPTWYIGHFARRRARSGDPVGRHGPAARARKRGPHSLPATS